MYSKKIMFYTGILILSSLMLLNSCDEGIYGSGNIVQEERDVKSFDAIEVSGAFNIYLSQGYDHSLTIEADDNLMRFIQTSVRGGKLHLDTRGGGFRRATFRAYVTVPDLNDIKASGAVKITGETPFDFHDLRIKVSGAADIDLEAYGDKLSLNISGAGKCYLTGEVEHLQIKLSGASKLNAKNLYARIADVNISGAGSATVNVDQELDAKISGAGNISYTGDPKVRSRVSGAGKVRKIN